VALDIVFPADTSLWVLLATLGVGVLAGVLPALRAAGLDPVSVLRHE
jgi:ABC-type lipoprotein release transport system permease subunit